jgi:GTPase SAR1 family protein
MTGEEARTAALGDLTSALPAVSTTSLDGLQSTEQRRVLNIVDSLRQCGLDGIVSLPQLVVCGDQSSGKSSVLEAITEIPFPRKENLCTRFATEIVLRRAALSSIATKIVPDEARPQKERLALENFKQSITDFNELPSLIDLATKAMGIGNDDSSSIQRAFAKDVLSIEISGPNRPQLTLVDLPGLIHSENKSQTREDVELVAELVSQYITNPRTIILPIISAKNDYANQIILQRARDADPEGARTLGIITKPDDLHPDSENEAAFIDLANNKDIFFKLGWHVLKNRGFKERDHSFTERNRSETKFLSSGKWSTLPRDCVGIEPLRVRLSELLFKHIKRELPKLRKDLNEKLEETKKRLGQLGERRSTATDAKQYLMRRSMSFYDITRASINGHYENQYFSKVENFSHSTTTLTTRRLRAMIQYLNIEFATEMQNRGHKYRFVGLDITGESGEDIGEVGGGIDVEVEVDDEDNGSPKILDKKQALAWAKQTLIRTRGRQLSGNFNPLLIGELFWEQSERWERLAKEHVRRVASLCTNFVDDLLSDLCPEDIFSRLRVPHVEDSLKKRLEESETELLKITKDMKRYPMTYNDYYTNAIQETRSKRSISLISQSMDSVKTTRDICPGKGYSVQTVTEFDPKLVQQAFQRRANQDMDGHSCNEALDCLCSFYKVP